MKLIMLLTIASAILTACSSIPSKMAEVHRGMTRAEAETILGAPDSASVGVGLETAYYDRVVAFGTRETFFVEYDNGLVNRAGSLGRRGPGPSMASMPQPMPTYQQPVYQVPIRRPVNCTSNTFSGTTYTNCN
jgi:hypothetical protein